MDIGKMRFPVYRIRDHQGIETKLGRTKILWRNEWVILDDNYISGDLGQRRLLLKINGFKLYPLYQRIGYLRQLLKYPSGARFIDSYGVMFRYKKSSKLYFVTSHKIIKRKDSGNQVAIWTDNGAYVIPYSISRAIKYASIMETKDGPLLYDVTKEHHDPYRRKI